MTVPPPGIRSSGIPLGALIEVFGHADAGGGARSLARSSLGALADAVRDVVTRDPSGVAGLRTDLSTLYNVVSQIEPKVTALGEGITVADAVSAGIRRDLGALFDVVADLDPRVSQVRQDALNLYDAVADLYGDTDRLGGDTTTLKAAAALVETAVRTITGVALGEPQPNLARLTSDIDARLRAMRAGARPGITPDGFTFVAGTNGFAGLGGVRAALPGLPTSMLVGSDNGVVARISGAGVLAMRYATAIEPGRLYRPRAVVQRRTDPTDPSGDAVAIVVVLLDQGLNYLDAVTVKQFGQLRTSDGRRPVETTMSRSASASAFLPVLDARTRFAVAAVMLYGLDGRTDVEVLEIEDATSAALQPPPAANYDARIGAIESKDLDPRVSALESAVTAPVSVRYASKGAAAAAAIPETAQVVEVMGSAASGDGGAGLYARTAGPTAVTDDTFTSHGVIWTRVDLSDAVFTGMIERWWARRASAAPGRSGAIWNNAGSWAVTP